MILKTRNKFSIRWPQALHSCYLQNWQFFLVRRLISQFLDLLQTYVAAVLFWMERLKKALQLKQVMAP